METLLHDLLIWVQQHPGWAGAAVFLIAMGESLVVVGLIVPGTVLMFGIGALVGSGALGLWETLAWAFVGAVAGDGLSFWLGHHYRDRIRDWWPFRRHPELMERGERFFRRHGGKSVLIGRFVGPVRPIIPAVAGMLGMAPGKFLAINIVSAFLWAPAYLLPGIAFGTSLALASQVAARLTAFLALVLVVAWGTWLTVTRLYRFLAPRAARLAELGLDTLRRHPRWDTLVRPWLAQDASLPRRLLALLPFLAGLPYLFGTLLQLFLPEGMDLRLAHLMEAVATPWGDHWMGRVAALASPTGLLVTWLIATLWWWGRHDGVAWRLWLSAALLMLPAMLPGFPASVPVLGLTLAWGLLVGLSAAGIERVFRPWLYGTAGLLILLVALARIYLGRDELSGVLTAISAGVIQAMALAAFHRREARSRVRAEIFALALVAALAVPPFAIVSPQRERPTALVVDEDIWWNGAWRRLPAYRVDLGGEAEQPLTVQWGGRLEDLANRLVQRGWEHPTPINWLTVLNSFRHRPALDELPVYPQLHDGRPEALVMIRREAGRRQAILRLWPSRLALPEGRRIWVGYVAWQSLEQPLGFLALLRTQPQFTAPRKALAEHLAGSMDLRLVGRVITPPPDLQWDGKVLLLRPPGGHP